MSQIASNPVQRGGGLLRGRRRIFWDGRRKVRYFPVVYSGFIRGRAIWLWQQRIFALTGLSNSCQTRQVDSSEEDSLLKSGGR